MSKYKTDKRESAIELALNGWKFAEIDPEEAEKYIEKILD